MSFNTHQLLSRLEDTTASVEQVVSEHSEYLNGQGEEAIGSIARAIMLTISKDPVRWERYISFIHVLKKESPAAWIKVMSSLQDSIVARLWSDDRNKNFVSCFHKEYTQNILAFWCELCRVVEYENTITEGITGDIYPTRWFDKLDKLQFPGRDELEEIIKCDAPDLLIDDYLKESNIVRWIIYNCAKHHLVL